MLQFCNTFLQIFFVQLLHFKNVVNETLQGLVDKTKRFVLCVNWRSSFWKSHLKSQLVGFYENVRTLHKMLFVFFPLPWIFPQGIFFRVFLSCCLHLRVSILKVMQYKMWKISETARLYKVLVQKITLSLDLWWVQVSLQRDSERQCNFSLLYCWSHNSGLFLHTLIYVRNDAQT